MNSEVYLLYNASATFCIIVVDHICRYNYYVQVLKDYFSTYGPPPYNFPFPIFSTNSFETKLLIHKATSEINAHCKNAP